MCNGQAGRQAAEAAGWELNALHDYTLFMYRCGSLPVCGLKCVHVLQHADVHTKLSIPISMLFAWQVRSSGDRWLFVEAGC